MLPKIRNLFLRNPLAITALFLFLTSCSQNIYPGRSQFLKDGDPLPTVDLNYYKSVQERPE